MIYMQPVPEICLCLNVVAGRTVEFSIENCSLKGRHCRGKVGFWPLLIFKAV